MGTPWTSIENFCPDHLCARGAGQQVRWSMARIVEQIGPNCNWHFFQYKMILKAASDSKARWHFRVGADPLCPLTCATRNIMPQRASCRELARPADSYRILAGAALCFIAAAFREHRAFPPVACWRAMPASNRGWKLPAHPSCRSIGRHWPRSLQVGQVGIADGSEANNFARGSHACQDRCNQSDIAGKDYPALRARPASNG